MSRNETGPDPDMELERELAQLKNDYETLREEKVRAEETLKHLEAELAALEERAMAAYGTADPAALAARLEAMRAENARLVAEYRAHIQTVRQGLNALDADHQ